MPLHGSLVLPEWVWMGKKEFFFLSFFFSKGWQTLRCREKKNLITELEFSLGGLLDEMELRDETPPTDQQSRVHD